ncbi:hypothetical protein SO694_00009446 [Aureococcus anophagefferens]|uniref:Ankyrin repeat domain-containing protein n=1 Tax=Aureococcus anophagefferens TaxID=44056 RepID=A0ABR1GEG5_AURAN
MADVSELSQRVLQLTLDDEPAQLRAALQDLEPEDERGFAATTDEGAYATHIAANFGRFHCLAELLDRGCPALRMPSGHTPLMVACQSGAVDCVAALVEFYPEDAVQNSRVDAPSSSPSARAPVYADAPEVGSADDVPVVDGAARAEVAVDLVDEAHARGRAGLAEWLREVGVFALAAAGLPLLCFANDIPAAWHPTLLRAGADPDVEPLGAFGRALWAGDERGTTRTWVPMARRPWRPDSHFLYPRGARRRAEAAAAVGWALERGGRRHLATIFTGRSCPTPRARAGATRCPWPTSAARASSAPTWAAW